MKPIRILSPSFELLAEIDDYESLIYTRKWFKPGDFELRINLNKNNTDKLAKGNLIILGSDTSKVGIIRHREIELSEGGKGSEQLRIVGTTLGGILTHRVIVPPSGLAYDVLNAQAESVMKHYVNNCLINPVDPARKIDQLVNATDQLRGAQIKREARYKNLSQELEEIGLATGLGWNISVDYAAKKWVFDVLLGRDLTHGNGVNPPVIFSPDYDSLQGQRYIDSDINYKNLGYVAGQGEGAAREVVVVGSGTGLERFEIFIDARDIEDATLLPSRGEQRLAEFSSEQVLEGQILTKSPFIYEKDWNLGDTVTVQNRKWGVTLNASITEVREVYEPGGFELSCTFGNSFPTLIDKIKQEFRQVEGEIRK